MAKSTKRTTRASALPSRHGSPFFKSGESRAAFSVQDALAPTFFSQSPFAAPSQAETATACAQAPAAPAVQRKCAACEAEKKILPQLDIGPVEDPLETEADAMADHVVRRQAVDMDDDEGQAKPLHAKAKDTASSQSASPGLQTALAGANGSGAPLAPHTRDQMEKAFGTDFSGVRVHTGAASAAMNEAIGARAFTSGTDIHFNDGEFAPGNERGTHLLAHELTHVVQQNSGVVRQGGTAPALQRKPKRTAEERAVILATAAQAAFTSYDEQLDAQVEAEELLGLNSKRAKDKTYAWRLGQSDRARIQKSGALTTELQHEITVKIRFFRDDAKRAYIQTITAAVSEAAEGEQVAELLAEPGIPGAKEEEEAEGLGCDAGKKQFPMLYEGEPERSTCIDIMTDKDFANSYFDDNIASKVAYAVPGTTWENVDYRSFNALVLTYKNGTSEYFMLDDVGNFYFGGQALTLREFFYYKRKGTGLIYPVENGRLHSTEVLTPKLISIKNGLLYTVKQLQELYTLLQTAGAFASIIGQYSVVEAFRVSLEGFKIPRGMGEGGGKGEGATGGVGGGAGEGEEPGGAVRIPGEEKTGGQSHGSGTPQKQLSSSQLKGTGNLTSDPVHPGMVRRGEATAGQTIYEYKLNSSNPDDRAEARMAARLAAEGYDVHFRANDKGGDLEVAGVTTDVKNPRTANVATSMSSAAQQGADQVIIDGTTVGLTEDQVRVGIDKYEAMAQDMVAGESRVRHPKLRELKTAFFVTGDGTMYVYHRGTSLKKAH